MALFKTVYSSSAQELGADGLGLASLPAEPVGGLFEKRGGFGRCCERAPPSTPSGRTFGTPARGQPPSRTPGGSSSLFDRYGADSSGFGRPTASRGPLLRPPRYQPYQPLSCAGRGRSAPKCWSPEVDRGIGREMMMFLPNPLYGS